MRLFIVGGSPRSRQAIDNLESICRNELAGRFRLRVVDVVQEPELAEKARVVATPTLIRDLPEPACRVIGNLADREKVIDALDLGPKNTTFYDG